ncbi:small secreted hydrophilic protein [Streptomyces sp. A244]|uniref:small secreted hydrophilic protein n=1 Tax=Streptomyces TaxID=1883 RepID=UPI000D1A8FEA|nr:small secreted hydrophilic protein [Streptomyces sp. A244]PTH84677.1 small secreted hydrophilic protein [Streptomyces sp. A244]
MVFSRRMAALSAVVLIPLGIAATSYALADSPESPRVPSQQVELDHGSPTPTSTLRPSPKATPPGATPGDEVVSRPPVTDSSAGDDDDDDHGQGTGDDGPGDDDGPGSDG